MKTFQTSFLFLSLALAAFSCKKDKTTTQETIQNNLKSGTWRISSFIDSGTDETYHFNGFSFTFQANGILTATNGTTTYTGSWSLTDSNSGDDSHHDLHFHIHFDLTNEFGDLNDDWHIQSQSPTKIELYDVSGGGSGTDYLTFEKN
ncbi:MAG: hypothetical protein N2110_02080 [Flavobacteriales bacterium]|nr:hypothetical protein [Flavobacteriales bacterium]MCX7767797.1 hypothetical protein [Flavobacteriales bacterium]MDW8409802.1 hypothetical protein [Flavobacteriales bacterium]